MKKYYAVKKGRTPGIYETWEECKREVTGFKGAQYKKFGTIEEAEEFLKEGEKISISDSNALISYVDGSFDKEDGSYSYGAIFIEDGEEKVFSKRFAKDKYSEHRNVSGEIFGAMFAIGYAIDGGYENLILHYDYEGIEKWATGEWKTNKELTRKYKAYCDKTKKYVNVQFVKVLAHSGDKYNEMADKAAKGAKI